MTRICVVAVVVLSLTVAISPVEAGAPLDRVQSTVAAAMDILSRPDLKGEANLVKRRAMLRRLADEMFDFSEMARSTLGSHWATSSESERAAFVALFTDLLERCYMRSIENYAGEGIVYAGETIAGDYATVRSKIVTTRRAEISVDYRLYRSTAGWLVFDVALENVSLVASYREQFNRIIRTTSFVTLLERMRNGQVASITVPPGAGKPH
jgi:phospholipid transport system substrate-binding protein